MRLSEYTGRFALDVELGNDAAQTSEDLAGMLRDAAGKLETGQNSGIVRDANGNTVGRFGLEDPKADTYNGSRNYETFTVSNELTNNRGLKGLTLARTIARNLIEDHEYQFEAAGAFRDWFARSANLADDGADLTATMICTFLDAVDWREVMRDVLDDGEGGSDILEVSR